MTKRREGWVLTLYQPYAISRKFDEIGRVEMIDTISLNYPDTPSGSMSPHTHEEIIRFWKMVDWSKSDEMLMEEFECCDFDAAIQEAQAAAVDRAEAYCKYKRYWLGHGVDIEHEASMERGRAKLQLLRGGAGKP